MRDKNKVCDEIGLSALLKSRRPAYFVFIIDCISYTLKEEELRKGGEAKYAHLAMELHVFIEVTAPIPEAYLRMAHAMDEVKKFLIPVCCNYPFCSLFAENTFAYVSELSVSPL